MIDKKEAERWANVLEHQANSDGSTDYKHKAAAALRELLAENATLTQECKALEAKVSRMEREVQELEAKVPKWRIITEDEPPLDVNLLLAYFNEWPSPQWTVESGWAGSTRGGWLHGQATHWMPLPETPSHD